MLFLPDQHLGRNTAVRELGLSLDDCVVWDPHKPNGGLTREQLEDARMILWRGHCSVHGRFSVDAVEEARREIPGVKVIVHPECRYEVVELADEVGSTEKIIKTIDAAPAGTSWAVGTELNLVHRLAQQFPEQRIAFLEKNVCYCSTMNRIDLPHLVWALESLVDGRVVNPIRVDPTSPPRPASPSTGCSPSPARPPRTDARWRRRLDRVAVVSDVHGNVTAYEAVLADIDARGITRVVNLGDVVGKGPRGPSASG